MGADDEEHQEEAVKESGGELASLGLFLGDVKSPGAGKLGPLLLKTPYFPSELPGSLVVLVRRFHLACLPWGANSGSAMLSLLHSAHMEALILPCGIYCFL